MFAILPCTWLSVLYICSKKERRFLVIDVLQLILVEPDGRRLGWGVVKFVGFLQVRHNITHKTK